MDGPEELDLVDGCDADMTEDTLPDDEVELFTLFAEALDPSNGVTVEDAQAQWEELFGVPPT